MTDRRFARTALAPVALGAVALLAAACAQPTAMETAAAPAQQDIVDTAVAAGDFTTLVAAVQAAGLVDTLKGPGPFTVFAPTDEAFAALPAGTVETLLMPENRDQLVAILTYHVLPGEVMSADIAGQTLSAATVEGSELSIDATDGVMVDDATVIAADVDATNGVIHVIDTVLMP
ncbi:MAG: fasciclin domain-containing protein [Azospirillaceae bacterium]